jgi:hypothetical protein
MAITCCELQLLAEAESVNGEETWSPLDGLLTETPAMAGTAKETESDNATHIALRFFMTYLCDCM